MNNREICDALASVFLEVELTVRLKHARSTDSVYMTVSNDSRSYVIRITNHAASHKYSKIYDYWIDTSRRDVIPFIDAAIQGAAKRFNMSITEVVPEKLEPVTVRDEVVKEEVKEVVSEKCVQTSDYSTNFYQENRRSMINLEQYYLSAQGFVCALDNNPEKEAPVVPLSKDGDSERGDMLKFWLCLVLILLSVWFFTK
jgi:hypothetical protein